MQDKTINNVLRHLHRECMNGRHGGMFYVLMLMQVRGIKPDFKSRRRPYGSRAARRRAKLRALEGGKG